MKLKGMWILFLGLVILVGLTFTACKPNLSPNVEKDPDIVGTWVSLDGMGKLVINADGTFVFYTENVKSDEGTVTVIEKGYIKWTIKTTNYYGYYFIKNNKFYNYSGYAVGPHTNYIGTWEIVLKEETSENTSTFKATHTYTTNGKILVGIIDTYTNYTNTYVYAEVGTFSDGWKIAVGKIDSSTGNTNWDTTNFIVIHTYESRDVIKVGGKEDFSYNVLVKQ